MVVVEVNDGVDDVVDDVVDDEATAACLDDIVPLQPVGHEAHALTIVAPPIFPPSLPFGQEVHACALDVAE